MKNRIALFIAGCCALFLFSCIKSDNTEYELSRDCQILSFSLSNDSISELSGVTFVIDQLTGHIYNIDSLPYGTQLNEKVICNAGISSAVMRCQVMQEAIGDTIDWNGEDSLDFSKPVKFVNTLWDGTTTKAYLAWVNIHQVVPDSMVWSLFKEGIPEEKVKEEKVVVLEKDDIPYFYMYVQPTNTSLGYQLYRSPVYDGQNWEMLEINGFPHGEICLSQITVYENVLFAIATNGTLYSSLNGEDWNPVQIEENYPVKALLGSLNAENDFTGVGKQISALAAIIEKDGNLIYASINHQTRKWEWNESNPAVAEGFPLSGFGSVSSNSMYRARLMVVAGRDKNNQLTNTSWATDDGMIWAELTAKDTTYFEKQEGVSVAEYDGKFFMLTGINESDKASADIYFSRDGGISWSVSDTLTVMPEEFKARGFSSIYVDDEQFMYLFGGKENTQSNMLNQIWRGRINRLGFKD